MWRCFINTKQKIFTAASQSPRKGLRRRGKQLLIIIMKLDDIHKMVSETGPLNGPVDDIIKRIMDWGEKHRPLPRKCRGCGKVINNGSLLCSDCWQEADAISSVPDYTEYIICQKCGEPMILTPFSEEGKEFFVCPNCKKIRVVP